VEGELPMTNETQYSPRKPTQVIEVDKRGKQSILPGDRPFDPMSRNFGER